MHVCVYELVYLVGYGAYEFKQCICENHDSTYMYMYMYTYTCSFARMLVSDIPHTAWHCTYIYMQRHQEAGLHSILKVYVHCISV